MKQYYTIGIKRTTTEYYQVIADDENTAYVTAESDGEFIEREQDELEMWVEEMESIDD